MKKKIASILMILALLMAFVSCNGNNGNDTQGGTDTDQTTNTKTVYVRLDALAKKNYSSVYLDITTTTGMLELNSSYEITKESVVYSVERLNTLPSDGNIATADKSYKTTLSGSAVIVDGKVESLDGDPVDIPLYAVLLGSFNFSERYFANVEESDGRFSADVVSPSDFFDTQKAVENMHITVEYNSSSLKSIVITYNTETSDVTIAYQFS